MPTIFKPKKKKNTDSERYKKRRKIYDSKLWQDMRKTQMMKHPKCEICEMEGKITLAIDAHHLDSFVNYDGMEMMSKAYDSTNLISLCKECHNRIHNGDLKGCKSKEEIREKLKNLHKNNKK